MNDTARPSNRILEFGSTALAITATVALAWSPAHTRVWMWWLWMGSALGLAVWAIRMRAWGVLVLNVTYFALDVLGLARLLGVL